MVKIRKFFNDNDKCNKKTPSERYIFLCKNAKKNIRLEENILYKSAQLSSVKALEGLKSNSIDVSKSSICTLLKKLPTFVDNSLVKNICVNDFAFRKHFSYGTVMVDLDSHRIIDLILTRNTEEFKNWLAEYPKIEAISRDGAQIYASAVKKSYLEVIQVSDRFHIIKGLTAAVTRYLIRKFFC